MNIETRRRLKMHTKVTCKNMALRDDEYEIHKEIQL